MNQSESAMDEEAEDEGSDSEREEREEADPGASTDISESEMETNKARDVRKGRPVMEGGEGEIDGAVVGNNRGNEGRIKNSMGHGEREGKIGNGPSEGEEAEKIGGFNAHGNLGKEHGKVKGQGKG